MSAKSNLWRAASTRCKLHPQTGANDGVVSSGAAKMMQIRQAGASLG